MGFFKNTISIFFVPSLCYLCSLGDLPGGLHLGFLNLSVSGFLQSPFPRQHGLDGLFNGPAIDLLILEREYKMEADLDFGHPCQNKADRRVLIRYVSKKIHSDLLRESLVRPQHGVSFGVLI